MKRIIVIAHLLIFALISSITVTAAEMSDTLCQAGKASELIISYSPSKISITVRDIDGSGENYFYKTGSYGKSANGSTSLTQMHDVADVLIVERDEAIVEISFKGRNSEVSNLVYDIPDAQNRYVQSYTGWKGDEYGLSLGRKGKSKWSLISNGLGMGWGTPLNSTPSFPTSMGRSMEWSWLSVLGVKWSYGPNSLESGVGVYWRNYSVEKGMYLEKNEDSSLSLEHFSDNVDKGKSRLQLFSLELPVLYTIRFGHKRNYAFTAGPVVNFNTGANIKTQYREGDRSYSIKTTHINQRPVTVDVLGVIHYQALGLYVRYSPMKVLKERTDLSFSSLSTGIMFLF